ncbi:MAG TPA: hypothetical protein ENJ95_10250 [Bacteroidetes bacterium]|nr:hypothetical protein [Bacteroidota bacterium]
MKTTTVEQQALSENIIKKVALRFFRQYYKFRLRYEDQPVIAKYDLEGVGGIIADGYYSFKKTDGRTFSATFEATSKASRDEVIYKPQMRILFWDGVAVASLATLVLVALNYFQKFQVLDERTVWVRLLLLLVSMVVSFFVFYLIAKNFRRYRYIYAVEQFKRYHADEQWIALAEDVFPNSSDKYFRELKEQCIYNGIGLLQVQHNLDTKILVTPSRQDIFLGKRKEVDFMPKKLAEQQMAENKFNAKWALLQSWMPGFLKNDKSVLRFQRSYNSQIGIAMGCFLLIGFLFMKEMELSGYQFVDRSEYRNDIAKSESNQVREQPEVLGDSLLPMENNSLEAKDFEGKIWTPKKKEQPKPAAKQAPPPPKPLKPKDTTEIVINQKGEKPIAYDCTRFYTFETNKYVIEEGVYPNWPRAERRLALLRNSSIPSAALLKSCFFPNEDGFMIYLGEIYNSPEEASQYIEKLNGVQQTMVRNVRQLKIVKLRPTRRF